MTTEFRTTLRTLALAAILGLFLVSQTGCLLLAVGAGTGAGVAYAQGDSDVMMDATPVQVAAAAEASAKEMGLSVVSNRADSIESKVVSRTADDARVCVYAKGVGTNLSKVYVRMGVFGDDAMQYRMIEKIKANLPAAIAAHPGDAPAPTPTTQPANAATADATGDISE